MRILKIFLVAAIFVFASGKFVLAHDEHEGHNHAYIDLEKLPTVSVKIQNNTDAFLSLTITNALCAPRIILKPGEEANLQDCLRYGTEIEGPIYHVRAVFYSKDKVLESRDFLFTAKPTSPWIFCKLPPNKSQC